MRKGVCVLLLLVLGTIGFAQEQSSGSSPPPIPENPDSLFGPQAPSGAEGGGQSAGNSPAASGQESATGGAAQQGGAAASGSQASPAVESPNSMFQGGMVQSAEKSTSPAQDLLVNKGIQLGGELDSTFTAYGTWGQSYPDPSNLSKGFTDQLAPVFQGTLYFDARPDQHFRVFGKAKATYPFQSSTQLLTTTPLGLPVQTQSTPNIEIFELFSDFDYKNKVYFRVGKQVVNWGVGYFFSPADVISLAPIDPQDPTVQREGPLALQMNVPFAGVDNFYLYLLANSAFASGSTFHVDDVAVAPKAEFVVGNYELGIGGYYQRNQRPKLMATASGSLGKIGLFGEAVLSQGTDRTLVRPIAAGSSVYESYTDTSTPFFSGTVGFNYLQPVWNLSLYAQYYYNGPGYADVSVEKQAYLLYAEQIAGVTHSGPDLSATDLLNPGRSYGAAVANWSNIRNSNLSFAVFWEGNFSDGSGVVSPSLSYAPFDHASFTAATHIAYGADNTQFVRGGRMSVSLAASLGMGSF